MASDFVCRGCDHYNRRTGHCSFGSCKATSVAQSFAGNCTSEFIAQPFVLPEEIAYLPTTYTDISSRYIGVRPYIFGQLRHKTLTKPHDLVIRFSFRVKITSSLATSDRKTCKAVFKYLFESQKFNDALIHRRMKSQASLIGANGTAKLNTVAPVHMNFPLVILPRYPELDDSLWLH